MPEAFSLTYLSVYWDLIFHFVIAFSFTLFSFGYYLKYLLFQTQHDCHSFISMYVNVINKGIYFIMLLL